MLVTFISQCEKNALKRTRRVLDAFANRIGDNVWQTAITVEGLNTVKRLLNDTASRSTAVSCHRVKTRHRTELVWIVGRKQKFNEVGEVAVNRTHNNHYKHSQNGWKCTSMIAVASGIASLFHDVGKSNNLFQNKLNPTLKTQNFEPYRHEWVSLRLFEAFVTFSQQSNNESTLSGTQSDPYSDIKWLTTLEGLANQRVLDKSLNQDILHHLTIDNVHEPFKNPFDTLPPLARLVAWLIVSHHRLPQYNGEVVYKPRIKDANKWLEHSFDAGWNSVNFKNAKVTDEMLKQNWLFDAQVPLMSNTWRQKAQQLAKRALRYMQFSQNLLTTDFTNRPFFSHVSRLCLMLADHYYSAQQPTKQWQDSSYKAYANTDKQKQYKQQLDEHNLGVAHHAYLLAKQLAYIRTDLFTLDDDKRILRNGLLTKQSTTQDKTDFGWQDKAYTLATKIQKQTEKQGFFGICIASTGKGKTLANARIMHGLSDADKGCRFSIALGLRSLTLQTGRSLKQLLKVDESDIATIIGSQAILNLEKEKADVEQQVLDACAQIGSESLDIGDDDYVIESDITVNDGFLHTYFANQPKAQKMLKTPVLVSTIDHLTPATEGVRGGRQIVPMLRLMTSDLVLDEPDEFNEADLPALARLVHWAGMLGAKVLLSTASMPPYFAYALFDAYQNGRKDYHQDISADPMPPITCAWFDEFKQTSADIGNIKEYINSHDEFASKRINNLKKHALPLRKASIKTINITDTANLYAELATHLHTFSLELHKNHHQTNEDNLKLSVGLIRFANINPLVAVAKQLYAIKPPKDTHIHYCIYHSQYPLGQRAKIEKMLDTVLARHDDTQIWQHDSIKTAISKASKTNNNNHIFIVLATSVAEVGRDHDYDWAIAEPSSMRSLIQLAGRIQRHRKCIPDTENFYVLSKNIKGMQGKTVCFEKPGFENDARQLQYKNMHDLLRPEEYQTISSIPCLAINKASNVKTKLVDMEHLAYRQILFGDDKNYQINAKNWWRYDMDWNSELQRLTRFRKSTPDTGYCFYVSDDGYEYFWEQKNEDVSPHKYIETNDIRHCDIETAQGNAIWHETDFLSIYDDLTHQLDKPLAYICRVYGEVRLRDETKKEWYYHPALGVFKEIND